MCLLYFIQSPYNKECANLQIFIHPTPLGQLFKIPPFSAPKPHSEGEGGVSQSIFLVEYGDFCYLGVHAKFQNPTTNLSGRISNNRRKINKKS
jgi:hypothetical protein